MESQYTGIKRIVCFDTTDSICIYKPAATVSTLSEIVSWLYIVLSVGLLCYLPARQ